MALITLRPTHMEGQFVDEAGRLWVRNDARRPYSNPPAAGIWCSCCGLAFGSVQYARQVQDGPVACHRCVEIVPAQGSERDRQVVAREQGRRVAAASEEG